MKTQLFSLFLAGMMVFGMSACNNDASHYSDHTVDANTLAASGVIDGYEYVDLDLPSGTLWGTCNLGAAQPEVIGDYFAWGETTTKTLFNNSSYAHCDSLSKLTKYCKDKKQGTVDNLLTLENADDIALTQLGGKWRTPTTEEQEELIYKCTWTLATLNGVPGALVTGRNGHSIFLPATGSYRDTLLCETGTHGRYWSKSLNKDKSEEAHYLVFYPDRRDYANVYRRERADGLVIRAINSTKSDAIREAIHVAIEECVANHYVLQALMTPAQAPQAEEVIETTVVAAPDSIA